MPPTRARFTVSLCSPSLVLVQAALQLIEWGCPHLRSVRSIVNGRLETTSQCALGIAAPQQLPDLSRDPLDIGLGDLRLWRVQGGGIEVDARVLGQGVDVDGAPVVAERGVGMLLNDGHVGQRTR